MSSPSRSRPTRLPRLRMRDDLLQADPTLARYMDEEAAAGPGGGSSRAAAPGAKTILDAALLEEELTEEQLLNQELEAVKRERASLLKSLAAVKASQEKTGAKIQEEDIKLLRQELDVKMAKVNELREEAKELEGKVEKYNLATHDNDLLKPDGEPANKARIAELQASQTALEAELVEHDAKNRLYQLLAVRTRREHDEMERKVGDARATLAAFEDDLVTLAGHAADVRASREDAEHALAAARRNFAGTQQDWHRKLQDRRKEVHEIEKRQQQKLNVAQAQADQVARQERAERSQQAKLHKEEQAQELKLLELQPKLEAMEASWSRLHGITAADSPEQVIAFWEGLQAQERAMRDLVKLAEERELRAKAALAQLLVSRSTALEEQGATITDASEEETVAAERSDGGAAAVLQEKIAAAQRRVAAAEKAYSRLNTVCMGAEQGLKSLKARLERALTQMPGGAPAAPASPQRRSSRASSDVKSSRVSEDTKSSALRKTDSMRKSSSLRKSSSISGDPASPAAPPSTFFPQLSTLLQDVGASMGRLMVLEQQMDAQAASKVGKGPAGAAVLMRGMRRRTWTGPAWLSLTDGSQATAASMGWKRAKGKKAGATLGPDLSYIYGYINEADENDAEGSGNTILAVADGESKFVDREFLKHRAAKLETAKHRQQKNAAGGRHSTAAPAHR